MIEISLNVPDWVAWVLFTTASVYVFALTPLYALQVYYQRRILELEEDSV